MVIKASVRQNGTDVFYGAKKINDDLVRVIPSTWHEILFLQTLEKGYSLFAPWNGNGVLVKAQHLPPLYDDCRH